MEVVNTAPLPGLQLSQTNTGKDKVAGALAKAQGAFKTIKKTKTANVPTKTGGKYSYSYADLSDIVSAVTPALSENGLSIVQGVEFDGLSSYLWHSSGQWLKNWIPMQTTMGTGPQAFASSLTYARRYGLCSLLNVVAEDDDDGAIAQHTSTAPPTQAPTHPNLPSVPSQGDWENKGISPKQVQLLQILAKKLNYSATGMHNTMKEKFGKESSKLLTQKEASVLIDEMQRDLKESE